MVYSSSVAQGSQLPALPHQQQLVAVHLHLLHLALGRPSLGLAHHALHQLRQLGDLTEDGVKIVKFRFKVKKTQKDTIPKSFCTYLTIVLVL